MSDRIMAHDMTRPTGSSEAKIPEGELLSASLPLARARRRRGRPARRSRPREFSRARLAHSHSRTDPPPQQLSLFRPTTASDPRDVPMGTSRATNAPERLDASKMRRAGKPSARTGAPTMAKLRRRRSQTKEHPQIPGARASPHAHALHDPRVPLRPNPALPSHAPLSPPCEGPRELRPQNARGQTAPEHGGQPSPRAGVARSVGVDVARDVRAPRGGD